MKRSRVLIVDDSALMRQILQQILQSDPALEVVGVAGDPYIAREKIKALQPDVLTLDVEMPRMDGLTFLEKLMKGHPMPVVMVSSLTEKGCDTTLRALSLGAVDFITKPKLDVKSGTLELAEEIIAKVKAAASARVIPRSFSAQPAAAPTTISYLSQIKATHKIVAIGASTGGTEALKDLLEVLPADFPGIVIVQHMPERFTAQFAKRLDSLCKISVKEAAEGDRILPGHALLAPGGRHMELVRKGAEYSVRITQTEPVNRHRPSVDVLFQSVADQAGHNAVGVILTGMGNDGARGMLAMKNAGAFNIAQDEASCVVFGMPKEAIAMGGTHEVHALSKIAPAIAKHL
jgi:two-component system, chemotaxis family, protein-glutamate methylesterase/glutaminase